MPWYPAAERVEIPWFGYPSGEVGGNHVLAVVHHIAEGSYSTLTSKAFWQTRNGGSGGSVHFAVAKDGRVAQLVDTDNAAYGNGIVLGPSWGPVSFGNPNEHTVSIEHEGFTGNAWPDEQYEATLKLTEWILKTHDLEPGPDTVIGHYRIDSVNRANCPGSGWPVARILAALVNPPEEDEMDPEDRVLLDWLKANKSALATTALVNKAVGFTQANDAADSNDAVSKGLRREKRRLKAVMGKVSPGSKTVVGKLSYELSLPEVDNPPAGSGQGAHA